MIVSGLVTWGILIANLASFLSIQRSTSRSGDRAGTNIQDNLRNLDTLTQKELLVLRGSVNTLIDNALTKYQTTKENDKTAQQ